MVNVNNHNDIVENIYYNLQDKGHDTIEKYVDYWDNHGRHSGEIDVLVTDTRNGKTYYTYYEVKTGRDPDKSRLRAEAQARRFFCSYPCVEGDKKTVVYVHPKYGVERWTQ